MKREIKLSVIDGDAGMKKTKSLIILNEWKRIIKKKMKNDKHYVYKITDPITNEYYIGSRSCNEIIADNYMGSYYVWKPKDVSRLVKEIIEENFETREDALEYEANLIKSYIDDPLNRNYHIPDKNFHNTNKIGYWAKHPISDETKNKLRDIATNQWINMEHPHKGKTYEEIYGEDVANEKKKVLSLYNKGKTYEEIYGEDGANEIIEKIRKGNTGKPKSPQTIHKLRVANMGKVLTEEHKQKIANSLKTPIVQFSLDGILINEYSSIKEASSLLGIGGGHICSCCKNKRKSAGGYIWKYKTNK